MQYPSFERKGSCADGSEVSYGFDARLFLNKPIDEAVAFLKSQAEYEEGFAARDQLPIAWGEPYFTMKDGIE